MTLVVPKLIGHRGARATAPENTLAGIRQARREGVDWIEFDAKLTGDGQVVLIHDETVDRTTDGRGAVREMTLAQIQRLDAGSKLGPQWRGEQIPTLKEALQLMVELGMGFNIEIKPCPGREAETARAALDVLDSHWPARSPQPIVSSFAALSLAAARDHAPARARGYLIERLPPDWKHEAERLKCAAVHADTRSLTRDQAASVKAAGYPLIVWTVNDAVRGRELLSWGVDSLITDTPATLAAGL